MQTLDAINRWLTANPVYASPDSKALTGAVAGTVNDHGSPQYWYGEIAGYYLSWAAWLAGQKGALQNAALPPLLTRLAADVMAWLEREWARQEPPLTRVHANGKADWRNDYLFSFDLAMILRGVADARVRFGSAIGSWNAEPVVDALRAFQSKNQILAAALPRTPQRSSPRWSLNPGFFQTKTAAGIKRYAQVHQNEELAGLADRLWQDRVDQWLRAGADTGLMPHPDLYALEGIAIVDQHSGDIRAQLRNRLTEYAERFFSDTSTSELFRLDVAAQWLRLARLYQCCDSARDRLSKLAAEHFDATFGLPLRTVTEDRTGRTWVTLFWSQALAAEHDHAEYRYADGSALLNIV